MGDSDTQTEVVEDKDGEAATDEIYIIVTMNYQLVAAKVDG